MKRIESTSDLIAWAREINFGVSLSRKCDMQDIYAHSNQSSIDEFFLAAGSDKRLIICSVNNALAFDEVERLLVVLAREKVRVELAEETLLLDEKWNALAKKQQEFQAAKKSIYKKIASLEGKVKAARSIIDGYKDALDCISKKCNEYKVNAEKFLKIKSLLS